MRATCGGQVWWSQQTGPRQLQVFPPGLSPSSGCTLPAVAWRDRRSWSHSRWAPAPSLGAVQLSAGSFHLGSLSLPVSPLEPVRPELSARPWACPGAGRSRWGPPQHPDPAVWFVEAGRRVPPSPLIHGNERGVCVQPGERPVSLWVSWPHCEVGRGPSVSAAGGGDVQAPSLSAGRDGRARPHRNARSPH